MKWKSVAVGVAVTGMMSMVTPLYASAAAYDAEPHHLAMVSGFAQVASVAGQAKAWAESAWGQSSTNYSILRNMQSEVDQLQLESSSTANAATRAAKYAESAWGQASTNKNILESVRSAVDTTRAFAESAWGQASTNFRVVTDVRDMISNAQSSIASMVDGLGVQKRMLEEIRNIRGGTLPSDVVNAVVAMGAKIAGVPCRETSRPGNPWWGYMGESWIGQPDNDCAQTRRDIREATEAARDIARRGQQAAEEAAKRSEDLLGKLIETARGNSEAIKETGHRMIESAQNGPDSWRAEGSLPSLGGWGNAVQCLALEPKNVCQEMAITVGHFGIEKFVLFPDSCEAKKKFGMLVDAAGALFFIQVAWLCSRWLLGSLGVYSPIKSGDE